MITEFVIAEYDDRKRRELARRKTATKPPKRKKVAVHPHIVRGLQAEGPAGYLRQQAERPAAEREPQGAQSFEEIAARLERCG